ncbi:hypothetical protein J2J97_32155 (plasmid) [Rhizobium bangladeshense]|uniref:hypothetical protein n=1 Tax=Rhizobium bangladeshense TaxID=1138189 RepID=UPI001A9923B5|nr:hypothetical protein [Rhizobium bangladeshense]QSY98559.1 hypothetical protein J2J97_32155 [Rhizobium bangladeshense]
MITIRQARNYLLICCAIPLVLAAASIMSGSWGWLISLPVWGWNVFIWGRMYKRMRDDELQRVAAERERMRRKIDLGD